MADKKIYDDEELRMKEALLYEWVKFNGFIPSQRELENTFNFKVSDYYSDYDALIRATQVRFKDFKTLTLDESIDTPEYRKEIEDLIKKNKRFIITAAVCGKPVDEPFYNSLLTYAKKNKAQVLVFPIPNREKRGRNKLNLDPKLRAFKILFSEYALNSNLKLWNIKIDPKQIQSLTGLDRITADLNASVIVGSTKQSLKYIPTSRLKVPHMVASTGCCTINDYSVEGVLPNRATKIAEVMHKEGGFIVEIESPKIFHVRNFVAGPSGEIADFGKLYKPDGTVEKVLNTTMVVGDLHVPKHDVALIDKNLQLIKKLGVHTVVLHDVVNMACISHHNENKLCTQGLMALQGESTILGEGRAFKEVLEQFSKAVNGSVVIPYSNHPAHLTRYLEEGRFVKDKDKENLYVSLKLATALIEGKNVLQCLMEELVGLDKSVTNVEWLNKDDTCQMYKIEAGLHGSETVNGRKGTPLTLSRGMGKMVSGHTHSPSIQENSYVVGIACEKDQVYNRGGLSSWVAASALVYPNGTVQLVNFIDVNGEYKYCI